MNANLWYECQLMVFLVAFGNKNCLARMTTFGTTWGLEFLGLLYSNPSFIMTVLVWNQNQILFTQKRYGMYI